MTETQSERKCTIVTPDDRFKARIICTGRLRKAEIDDILAKRDAATTADKLVKMLEKWYGKKYDDFVLITLHREGGYSGTKA